MINTKLFSRSNVPKIIKFCSKSNHNFPNARPASKDEIKQTAEFYETVAKKYHAANDLVTLGFHRSWRTALANNIEIYEGSKILDAPAGTGLNTLKVLEKSKHLRLPSDSLVTMFDINPHMMKVGQDNFKRLGYNEGLVNFVEGDLHKLPFDDESFDIVISSLANRPYVDYGLVLKEINRVLKWQGKIIILDYCFSQNPTITQRLFCNYIEFVASRIEKIILGNLKTAEFVTKSIRDVVSKTDLQQLLKDANFHKTEFQSLTLGIAGLTVAYKK